MGSRRRASTVAFVVLAYAFSWGWWVPLAVQGTTVDRGQGWPTHLVALAGPALAAVVVTGAVDGGAGLRDLWSRIVRWRVPWTWYGVIALTVGVAVVSALLGPDVTLGDLTRYSGAPAVGFAVVAYVLVVNGFGEEIGWRGFLCEHLLQSCSTGRTALLVWPIWGLWHLPLFWVVAGFRDLGVVGTVGWVLGIGFGSVVLTWLYDSALHSILVVALWHTAYNLATATDAADGAGAAIVTAGVIVAGVVILRRPSTWRVPSARTAPDA